MATDVPDRARVVIVGGGVMGCSLAYHLTRAGCRDVLLLEQGSLSGGSTWHAAGIIGQVRAHPSLTSLAKYSVELYGRLEAETGQSTGWQTCGSMWVARTPERMTQLRRVAAVARGYDVEVDVLTAQQAEQRWPLMRADDLHGAIWLPGDGKANPADVTQALARGARQGGARIVEGVRVTGVTVVDGRACGVTTNRGHVEAEVVVNCAGQWAKKIGAMAGVAIPLHSAEHFYIVTDQIDGVTADLPTMRDPDGYVYFKEEVRGLLMGGFEPQAKPWVSPDEVPDDFEFRLLDEDWDQFSILMDNAIERVPAIADAGIKKFVNGPESFTPDVNFLLGEAPEVRSFYVACGFNSGGIASAGGAGLALADWILAGEPPMDLWPVDIRRFAPFNNNSTWLRDRVTETLGAHYAMPWPNREPETARPLRRSPVHHLLDAGGAVWGTKMGWERANWFAPEGVGRKVEYSFGKQNWLPISGEEHRAARERVAVFDQTSFSKFVLKGRDAQAALQALCTNDVAAPPGAVIYTGMLNDRGGYESDFTVTRVASDEYLIVTSSAQTTRDMDYLQRHIPVACRASVVDVTSAFAVFGVMGPASRQLLQRVSRADLGNDAFPFSTSRLIDIGYATVRATRITYVGELGWELYVPAEFAVSVYETLRDAGADLGLAQAGYYAIDSLRLEKAYRAWARELTPDYTPVEAGLTFACKLGTSIPFRGREAVEAQRRDGVRRRLVSLVLDHPCSTLWGDELILRDGVPAGRLSSGAYGHTLGAAVGMGYVTNEDGPATADWLRAGRYELDISGDLVGATVHLRAPYDPTSARVKA